MLPRFHKQVACDLDVIRVKSFNTKGEKMEFAKHNIQQLRECSVMLWRCDIDSRWGAPRAEGDAEPAGSAASHDHVQQDYTGMPVLVIKTEHDAVDSFTIEKPEVKLECLSGNLDDDFNMKTEDEACEVMVKQELDVGPTVLQAPPVRVQASLDPLLGTSPGGSGAASPLYTDFSQTILRPEEQYNNTGSRDPSSTSFKLNLRNTNNVCKKLLREPFYGCCDSEGPSTSSEVGGLYRCRVRSQTECNRKKAKAGACTGSQQYECHHCKYITMKKSYLINHMRIHISKKSYECERCEYSTSNRNTLIRHIRIHTGEKPHKCEQCGWKTSRLSHLKSHIRTHTGEKPYKCEQCRYSASRIDILKSHMRIHTGERPYKCKHCQYSASRLFHLKRHMRTHTVEKRFKCEQCGYGTSHLRNLKSHMHRHTDERPYRCKQCQYSASYLSSLRIHMRTHTGERPYKCKQCEYSASHLPSLKRHLRTHTGERPYKCELCEYSASLLPSLKRHLRTHTCERPYKHEQCEYRVTALSYLK